MGRTIDFLNGRREVYITCDNCGLPILGEPRYEDLLPFGIDHERYTHPNKCPTDDDLGDVEQPM